MPWLAKVMPPPPKMLFGWVLVTVLLWKTTSMVVPVWPVKSPMSPAAPAKVEPVTVAFTTVRLLRASTARASPSLALLVRPKVVPVMVSRLSVPLVLTSEKLRPRPPEKLQLVTVAEPVMPVAPVALPK